MALTPYQHDLCKRLAERREGEESYIAGGVALNTLAGAPRISRDIDLFHDTQTALQLTWEADRIWLEQKAYSLEILRERPTYIEVVVGQGSESVLVQWLQDSAFRFFPLQPHPDFGWTLHPLDLATNKLLAMAGRLEARDWVDMITCHQSVQPLGFLAFAACGKDPGYNPLLILDEAARSSHYSQVEIEGLDWAGPPPDAGNLSRVWKAALKEAHEFIDVLPLEHLGKCVLNSDGSLFCGSISQLQASLEKDELIFHAGAVRGVWPELKL